jgi:hypothetical protein
MERKTSMALSVGVRDIIIFSSVLDTHRVVSANSNDFSISLPVNFTSAFKLLLRDQSAVAIKPELQRQSNWTIVSTDLLASPGAKSYVHDAGDKS